MDKKDVIIYKWISTLGTVNALTYINGAFKGLAKAYKTIAEKTGAPVTVTPDWVLEQLTQSLDQTIEELDKQIDGYVAQFEQQQAIKELDDQIDGYMAQFEQSGE